MPIECNRDQAVIQNAVSAEQAEGLLEWLLEKPSVKVDLATLRLAGAPNQAVKSSAQVPGCEWPQDAELRAWLMRVLKPAP
ncbi:MAG: hypothetical protein ABR898_01975 [Terracidiphilus sp.]|jgi:hypothetical protein